MKNRFLLGATAIIMALSLAGCGEKAPEASVNAPAKSVTNVSEVTSVSKETVSVSSVETVVEEPVEEPIQEGLVTEAPEEYEYSVVITINPQITLYVTYDENGEAVVNSFKFDNDDARDAYSELNLANLKTDDAVKLIIKTAAEKEYLKADGDVTIDVQPVGDMLPLDVVESYKEVAEVTVREMDGHTGGVVIHNYDLSGNEVVTEEPKTEEKKEVAKSEDKKDTSKETKKEESKKESKTETKKEEVKTETKAETPASTPAATPEPAPAPAPEVKKVCDLNGNLCSRPDINWSTEHYDEVPYEYRIDHTDTWYTIMHAVHKVNGTATCNSCGGTAPLHSYDADVWEENWYYEFDANAYNAAYGAAWDEYCAQYAASHPEDEDAWGRAAGSAECIAYANSHVSESNYYSWVQH